MVAATDAAGSQNSTVFIFAGQGSQKPGMAAEFFRSSATFRESLQASARICDKLGYHDLLKYLVHGEHGTDEPHDTIGSQLALVAFEIALTAMWKAYRGPPQAVIGNSIGEYAALCVAGVLSSADALYLVYRRALLLQKHCQADTYKMLVVAGQEVVRKVDSHIKTLSSSCRIACFNSPRKVVVGGPKEDVDILASALELDELRMTILPTPYAFHTSQIDAIAAEFATLCHSVTFKTIELPFGSTLLGCFMNPGERISADHLVRHACEPAQFTQTLTDGFKAESVSSSSIWLEIGPSATCLGFVKDILGVTDDRLFYSCVPSSITAHSHIGQSA